MLAYPLILVRSLLHNFSVDNNVSQWFIFYFIFGVVVIAVVAVFRFVFKFFIFIFVFLYILFFLTWFRFFFPRRLNSNFFRTLPVGAFTGLPNLLVL